MSAVQNLPRLADWQAAAAAGFGVARPGPRAIAVRRADVERRKRRVAIGDGAKRIQNTVAKTLPGCRNRRPVVHEGHLRRSADRSTATRNCARWSRPVCEALEVGRGDVLAVRDGSVQSLDTGQRS